ncbi:MAG: hypothetical protein ACHP84_03570 [Caulobacterales bacterium]
MKKQAGRAGAIRDWVGAAGAVLPSPWSASGRPPPPWLDDALAGAQVVFLGEMNHFVHEKTDYRLLMADMLLSRGWSVFGEELGWADGRVLQDYFAGAGEGLFDGLAMFGDASGLRQDRDDRPTGLLRPSFDAYPVDLMRAEQTRFYRDLKAAAEARAARIAYFGVDIDALPGAGYARTQAPGEARELLSRVPGESAAQEARRLRRAQALIEASGPDGASAETSTALAALADSLDYIDRTYGAATYDALKPGMAFREDCMKRRFADMRRMTGGAKAVLMAHALHLAKDDALLGPAAGVGPGGGLTRSLGAHIVQELGLKVFSVWMIYGAGEDAQPFPDLPRKADYTEGSLNRILAGFTEPVIFPVSGAPPGVFDQPIGVGHMYNALAVTPLAGQVDAILYLPRVTPLRMD